MPPPPPDIPVIMAGLMVRMMARLNGDPNHDDAEVRKFCQKLGLPYTVIRRITFVHPAPVGLNSCAQTQRTTDTRAQRDFWDEHHNQGVRRLDHKSARHLPDPL
jgi:hypothetical protein